jgi:hypothetical protein
MLINGVLNLAIGIALTFGVVSLVTSAITEGIASVLALRSKILLSGIKQLLNDPQASGLALAVYQHAAVNPLGSGVAPTAPANWRNTEGSYQAVSGLLGKMPSYIDPKGFASALIDVIQNRQQPQGFIPDVEAAINKISDVQVRAALQGFYERAGKDADKLHASLATWFDSSMARLSGDYKRKSQWIGLLVAATLVITMDVDAISIARHIYVDPALVLHAGVRADISPEEAFKAWAATFPFGWNDFAASASGDHTMTALLQAVPGWILTILATLFGAPFWFDTLQRFVQIRGTGPESGSDPTQPKS